MDEWKDPPISEERLKRWPARIWFLIACGAAGVVAAKLWQRYSPSFF